jgi:hypothetical protein
MIESSVESKNTVLFVNLTAMISAAVNCLGPDHGFLYLGSIQTLTNVISNKVDLERKNAAILLGNLSKNEACREKMRETHAIEVLSSISGSLGLSKK